MSASNACPDCGVDTNEINEWYMIHDHLWAELVGAPRAGCLCIGCLEARLGRELWSGDFSHWPVNNIDDRARGCKSPRLVERLMRAMPIGTAVAT